MTKAKRKQLSSDDGELTGFTGYFQTIFILCWLLFLSNKNLRDNVAVAARVFNQVNFFETAIIRIHSLSSLMFENRAHICDTNKHHKLSNMPNIMLS